MKSYRSLIKLLLLCLFISVMAGCGGGGGNSATPNIPVDTGTGSGSGAVSSISMDKNTIEQNGSSTVTVKYTRSNGLPAAGITVNFTTTRGTVNPASVVTDANGNAVTTLSAGTTAGQGEITANATVDGKTEVKNATFQVSLPPLHLSEITFGTDTLSYGGTTSVTVSVLDANNAVYTGQEVNVYFSSVATTNGKATIASPVSTVNGVAIATYKAATITGTDTVTATISGSSKTKSLTVTPLSAGSISYISATPTNLALKGTGGIGRSEVSVVTFKVLDSSGAVRPNTTVNFSLNTSVGGIGLSATSGSTDSNGIVAVQVSSGNIATPVRVMATVGDSAISTQSEQLVISTGLPAQDGFSISIANLSPESFNIDGIKTTVTARLSDHFHNPVPDGTAVYFTTSGGSIQPSCTTVGGVCSVDWTSQNPRPYTPQAKKSGRAVILAYSVGEEAFIDYNGNGVADAGEFEDTTGAFRDDNENGLLDINETFIPFNKTGEFDPKDLKFNGILQGASSIDAPKSKHIFSNSTLVMATSAASISNSCGNSVTVAHSGLRSCIITVSDLHGNTMPTGTKVTFSFENIVNGIKLTSNDYTFPNSSADSGVPLTVTFSDSSASSAPFGRGILTVKVQSPGGVETVKTYNVSTQPTTITAGAPSKTTLSKGNKATVVFTLKDDQGTALPGINITLGIVNSAGTAASTDAALLSDTATTDVNGKVVAEFTAKETGSFRVKATVGGISVLSQEITIP